VILHLAAVCGPLAVLRFFVGRFVGHPGSKNPTREEFLAAAHPRVAVISAGENSPYGHPSPELLEKQKNAGTNLANGSRRRGAYGVGQRR